MRDVPMSVCSVFARVSLLVVCGVFGGGASCFGDGDGAPDAGIDDRQVVGVNCGDQASPGNGVGIGKFCTATADCPIADDGTTIQCSTVLTDNTLPLLCSRICGDTDGGSIDCGDNAACANIAELGFDLTVCVPFACDPLFDAGVPRP
jgi:hypothetical protein